MIELRVRTRIPEAELQAKVGKLLTERDYNVLLTGPTKVRKPDGSPLCIYRPGVLRDVFGEAWDTLSEIRRTSYNRGQASGSIRVQQPGNPGRSKARPILSAMLGAFDPYGANQFCRLTSYTTEHPDAMRTLEPIFRDVARHFAADVPERFRIQMEYAARTHPDWLIAGTPFTTITVNNTYPTGVHQDSGDLEAGFSCLAVARRGDFAGGVLTFPAFRVGVDLRDGDLLLMDAHEYHGNTPLRCGLCAASLSKPNHRCSGMAESEHPPERVSVVCYFRTDMTRCESADGERAKREANREQLNRTRLGIAEANPREA